MKKVYTDLYYQSDCTLFEIKIYDKSKESTPRYVLHLPAPDSEIELSANELRNLASFIQQFLVEHNGEEVPKPVKHDPRFAPDPNGLLGF